MANYVNQFVDPANVSRNAFQKYVTATQLKNALNQQERENQLQDEEFNIEAANANLEFLKLKSSHMGQVAKNISALPSEERVERYKKMLDIAGQPIVTSEKAGPLGVIDTANMFSAEEFANLDDEGQKKYLELLYTSADDMAELKLQDEKSIAEAQKRAEELKNEKELIALNHSNAMELVTKKTDEAIRKAKEEAALEKKETGDPQKDIDTYQKELARIAKVKADLGSGSDIGNLMKTIIASSGGQVNESDTSDIETAKAALTRYEDYLKKRIRTLSTSDNDPLGLFK